MKAKRDYDEKGKLKTILMRPIFSNRFDSIIKTCAAFIGFILFVICGIFMALWGNLAGDLWPIPKDPAPLWIRLPLGIMLILVSGFFLKSAREAIKKMSSQQEKTN